MRFELNFTGDDDDDENGVGDELMMILSMTETRAVCSLASIRVAMDLRPSGQ